MTVEQSPALIQQLLLLQPSKANNNSSNEGNVKENVSVVLNPIQLPSFKGDLSLKTLGSNESEVVLSQEELQQQLVGLEGVEVNAQLQLLQQPGSFQLNERQKGMGGLFTVEAASSNLNNTVFTPPGADLVTKDELNLCTQINLLPQQFLTIKLAFLLNKYQVSL